MFRLAVVLGLLAGCAGMSPPPASPADATRAKVELAELQNGRSLLLSKCGGCHRPPMPAEHRAHDWPTKLGEMSARAHVDDQQRRLIEEYLVTMSTR
jgi:mono/diheme cytochrome c family protein